MKHRTRSIRYLLLVCLLVTSCGPAGTATPSGTSSPSASALPVAATTVAPPEPTASPSPLPTPQAGGFESDGELDQGWYWLQDDEPAATARWKLSSLQVDADIVLDLTVLATDANLSRGLPAEFNLSFGIDDQAGQAGEFNRQVVYLPNTASDLDPQGFICSGTIVIDHALIPAGVTSLWVKASRLEQEGMGSPTGTQLAFRSASLKVEPPLPAVQMVSEQIYQGGDFSSSGDFINGWWWLRDSAHQASATWNFTQIPPGTADIDIDFEVLATDRPDGAGGLDAVFYISYGPIPDMRLLEEVPVELVTLPNTSPADDPVSYTCQGTFTIPRTSLPPGTDKIWVKISRVDNQGQNPVDMHVAFTQPSVTFSEGSTTSGDGNSQEDAILITTSEYTGSMDAGDGEDWYKIYIGPKQVFSLESLTPPGSEFKAALYDPGMNLKQESVVVAGELVVSPGIYLAHVASGYAGGYWYLKFWRVSGEGEYRFYAYVETQNEAGSGGDAGDVYTAATRINNGTYSGILMEDDLTDYYQVTVGPGQEASFELTNAFQSSDPWTGSTVFNAGMRGSDNLPFILDKTTQNGTAIVAATVSSTSTISYTLLFVVTRLNGKGGPYTLKATVSGVSACDGVTADANTYYTSAAASPDWNWLQDGGRYLSATWVFRTLPPGTGDYHFGVNLPMRPPEGQNGTPEGKFYLLYGPIPAPAGGRIYGPELITLETETDPTTITGYVGHGEFSLPRANLGTPPQGFWLRIYRADPSGFREPVDTVLGVSQPAIKLCLGEQLGVTVSTPAAHPQATVSLDATTQVLSSSTSIFVDPGSDLDGDGLNQNWETAASNAINPVIEVDEEELWLHHRDDQSVVNFVRVYPWPSITDPQYIIFHYLETWSMDYGSGAQNDLYEWVKAKHRGDSESILMAWKVLDDQNIEFEWVYTSAHSNEVTDHSGVWHAHDRQCNPAKMANQDEKWIGTEKICASLEYEMPSGRLKLYTAENKHGIYVNSSICNSVRLVNIYGAWVGENCGFDPSDIVPFQWEDSDFSGDPRYQDQGGGRWLWTVYNVGEPDNYLINELGPYLDGNFNNEAVWSGNSSNPADFCGGMTAGGDIPAKCSGRIGSKYEGTPARLTSRLNPAYKVTVNTTIGLGGNAYIYIYDAQGIPLADGLLYGSFMNGMNEVFYLPELNQGGMVDHIKIIQINQPVLPVGWYVSTIEVTDLVHNWNTTFTANRLIPYNTEVTLP